MGVKGVIARYARWGVKDDSFGCRLPMDFWGVKGVKEVKGVKDDSLGCCLPMVLSLTPLTPS